MSNFPLLDAIKTLTPRERDVLGQVFICQDQGQPKKILEKLHRRGLVSFEKRELHFTDGLPPLIFERYYLDFAQNYAYCCWCAENDYEESDS